MFKITGFRIGYMCPNCKYIRPEQNMKSYAVKWFEKNYGMSEIKCPTCKSHTLFKEWDFVKYPCIVEKEE